MPSYLHPGVYVQEVPSGVRPVAGVPTSTTIFVGETERGPIVPTKIQSRSDYERLFGGHYRALAAGSPNARVYMPMALDGFFENGGSCAYILRALDAPSTAVPAFRTLGAVQIVEAASPGVWGNRLSVVLCKSSDDDDTRWRYAVRYRAPDGSQETIVEDWDRLSAQPADENFVMDVLLRSRYIRWPVSNLTPTRPADADLDLHPAAGVAVTDAQILAQAGTALAGGLGGGAAGNLTAANFTADHLPKLAEIDDAALLVCGAAQLLDDSVGAEAAFIDVQQAFVDYVSAGRPNEDLFYIGDLPRMIRTDATTAATAAVAAMTAMTPTNYAAMYWPHVTISDPVGAGANGSITIPSSGYIAGLYSRLDERQGVWNAPAGTEAGILALKSIDYQLLDSHSDDLNPKGINALRLIPGFGLVCWGARTMQPDPEWRYVPLRRTAIFLRMSIRNGIQWAVFEPNDGRLWTSLRSNIESFMETQFRNGAFAGSRSNDAYFVRCDAQTTSAIDQAAGIVNVLVGFAPLRPAEFVVLRVSQKTGEP